jgi:hypothetical protein
MELNFRDIWKKGFLEMVGKTVIYTYNVSGDMAKAFTRSPIRLYDAGDPKTSPMIRR